MRLSMRPQHILDSICATFAPGDDGWFSIIVLEAAARWWIAGKVESR